MSVFAEQVEVHGNLTGPAQDAESGSGLRCLISIENLILHRLEHQGNCGINANQPDA